MSFLVFSAIASFFVFRFGITKDLWVVSVMMMAFFAWPAFIGLMRLAGSRGLLAIVLLSSFALGIESLAIYTGFPYGRFFYEDGIGPKAFGLAPIAVFFGWSPLVIGAYALAIRYFRRFPVVATAAILVCADLVIDPGAYLLRIWIWEEPGVYYGVPFSNFLGWALTGWCGGRIMHFLIPPTSVESAQPTPLLTLSLAGTLVFWSGVAWFSGLWIPAVLGSVMVGHFVLELIKKELLDRYNL